MLEGYFVIAIMIIGFGWFASICFSLAYLIDNRQSDKDVARKFLWMPVVIGFLWPFIGLLSIAIGIYSVGNVIFEKDKNPAI